MIEEKSKAIVRALSMIRGTKTEVALYFANGKLNGSRTESAMHERRLKIHGDNLVGVYSKGCDFDLVIEDIEEFYKEFDALNFVPVQLDSPAPVFRSSGRKVKHDSL